MSAGRDDFSIAFRSALLQKGAKQKFSLFFFICLSVLILFLGNYSNNFTNILRKTLNDGIYRVSLLTSFPVKIFDTSVIKIKSHFFIYKENKILKEDLEILKNKNYEVKFLQAENKKLKEVLKSSEDNNFLFVTAKVLLDKKSPFLKSVIINKGAKSKIVKGMPVVDGSYLVGRIVEVNYLSSRVLLLNDLNSRIPIIIETSGDQAILSGHGGSMPILEYLPETYLFEKNKIVFTSGKDGFFPAGIAVGKTNSENSSNLSDEEKNFDSNKNKIIRVKLFSNPNQLSFLKVLLKSYQVEKYYGDK